MFSHQLALSRSTTSRDAERRLDPGLLEALAADPATRVLLIDARGRVALTGPTKHPDLPDDGLTPPTLDDVWEGASPAAIELPEISASALDLSGLTTLYLGCESGSGQAGRAQEGSASGTRWLAVVVPQELEVPEAPRVPVGGADAEGAAAGHPDLRALLVRHPLSALRGVGAQMGARDAGLATAAAALAAWHAVSHHCPACGGPTSIVQAGWARRCAVCGALHFPRTDPAVIMSVTDNNDRILLVHGAAWEKRRFSVVAGFVEAGESVEAAVVREVAEETGLAVASVEYVASQPWPFPRSLMLGYRARLAPGQPLARPDGREVTDAVVVSREELTEAVAQRRIVLPGATSIARLLIEDWYGGPIKG